MRDEKRNRYFKFELTYKQKQKLLTLSNKYEFDPETILQNIENFLDKLSSFSIDEIWDKVVKGLSIEFMKSKIRERSDDIIETKKRINMQKKLLHEYEDDYLAIVELGKALELLNKL
ncbi:MAG: hypothetical protein ACTSUR_06385 [Candidatus Heimdallarchaeaceae archaeon]